MRASDAPGYVTSSNHEPRHAPASESRMGRASGRTAWRRLDTRGSEFGASHCPPLSRLPSTPNLAAAVEAGGGGDSWGVKEDSDGSGLASIHAASYGCPPSTSRPRSGWHRSRGSVEWVAGSPSPAPRPAASRNSSPRTRSFPISPVPRHLRSQRLSLPVYPVRTPCSRLVDAIFPPAIHFRSTMTFRLSQYPWTSSPRPCPAQLLSSEVPAPPPLPPRMLGRQLPDPPIPLW